MTQSSPPIIVYFPSMLLHPASALPSGAKLLDPGIAADADQSRFRPDNLPLDELAAKAHVRDLLQFGELAGIRGELPRIGAAPYEDFYKDTSMSIRSELQSIGRDDEGGEKLREARSRAQLVLLLAWAMEERLAEMETLNQDMKESWSAFGRNLGLADELDEDLTDGDQDDVRSALQGAPGVDALSLDHDRDTASWQRVLEAMLVLLDPQTLLLTDKAEIRADMEEYGVRFEPAETGLARALGIDESAGRLLAARAPGYRFLLKRRPSADIPLLDGERTLLYLERA